VQCSAQVSGTLLRRNGGEGGPALLDFLAATVRTEDLSFFVVDEGQNFREVFLAIVAEKFVAGHRTSSGKEWLGKF
jgi:hypothetical protein